MKGSEPTRNFLDFAGSGLVGQVYTHINFRVFLDLWMTSDGGEKALGICTDDEWWRSRDFQVVVSDVRRGEDGGRLPRSDGRDVRLQSQLSEGYGARKH